MSKNLFSSILQDDKFQIKCTFSLLTHIGRQSFNSYVFIFDMGAMTSLICSRGLGLSSMYIKKWKQYDKQNKNIGYISGIESDKNNTVFAEENIAYIHEEASITIGTCNINRVSLRVSHELNCDFLIGLDILSQMRYYVDIVKETNKVKLIGMLRKSKSYNDFIAALKKFNFIEENVLAYQKEVASKDKSDSITQLKSIPVTYNRNAQVSNKSRGNNFDSYMSVSNLDSITYEQLETLNKSRQCRILSVDLTVNQLEYVCIGADRVYTDDISNFIRSVFNGIIPCVVNLSTLKHWKGFKISR